MKFNPTRLLLLGFVATLSSPVLAQDSGADIFTKSCVLCHGADGTGNTPAGKAFQAASLKDPKVTSQSDAALHAVVKNGKNKMPAFKDQLTDKQIDSVIAYVRTLSK